eukprot:275712_1
MGNIIQQKNKPSNDPDHQPFQDTDYRFKIMLTGDDGVGKSTFLYRFMNGIFYSGMESQAHPDFTVKTIVSNLDTNLKLEIWDLVGRHRTVDIAYCRKSDGILLMYDVTCEESFLHIRNWISDITNIMEQNVPIILLGNKKPKGMFRNTIVTTERGQELANKLGIPFFEVDSKTSENIANVFMTLVDNMFSQKYPNVINPFKSIQLFEYESTDEKLLKAYNNYTTENGDAPSNTYDLLNYIECKKLNIFSNFVLKHQVVSDFLMKHQRHEYKLKTIDKWSNKNVLNWISDLSFDSILSDKNVIIEELKQCACNGQDLLLLQSPQDIAESFGLGNDPNLCSQLLNQIQKQKPQKPQKHHDNDCSNNNNDTFNINFNSQDELFALNRKVTKHINIRQLKELFKEQTGVCASLDNIYFYSKQTLLEPEKELVQCNIVDDKNLITVYFGVNASKYTAASYTLQQKSNTQLTHKMRSIHKPRRRQHLPTIHNLHTSHTSHTPHTSSISPSKSSFVSNKKRRPTHRLRKQRQLTSHTSSPIKSSPVSNKRIVKQCKAKKDADSFWSTCGSYMEINGNTVILYKKNGGIECTAYSSSSLSNSIHKIKFKVLTKSSWCKMYIGIVSNPNHKTFRSFGPNVDAINYGYSSTGCKYTTVSEDQKYGEEYSVNDIITIYLNFNNLSISFYKNGKYLGVLSKIEKRKYHIAIHMSVYSIIGDIHGSVEMLPVHNLHTSHTSSNISPITSSLVQINQ